MTVQYRDLAVKTVRGHIVDLGHKLLGPFSRARDEYAAKALRRKGVEMHLDRKVTEVGRAG